MTSVWAGTVLSAPALAGVAAGLFAGLPLEIPSPTAGVWWLGPIPIRGYAFSILAGIVVAVWWTQRRIVARGGTAGQVLDISAWAVPFGIVGGRIYHLITTPQPYFGPGGNPWNAFRIWEGGLGIWGAVTLGALGAWIGARRAGLLLPPIADSIAPGIVLAQAIGRLGNWFNNELYGSATTLPWGLQVHQFDQAAGRALTGADGAPLLQPGLYHPTFLYELLWNLGVCLVLLWADRRWRFGHGRLFALYVLLYTCGRFWIELLRTDEAHHVLGLRLNVWTSVVVGSAALVHLLVTARRRGDREIVVERVRTG